MNGRVWHGRSGLHTRRYKYIYGILLLELFTGNKPTDDMFNDALSIPKISFH